MSGWKGRAAFLICAMMAAGSLFPAVVGIPLPAMAETASRWSTAAEAEAARALAEENAREIAQELAKLNDAAEEAEEEAEEAEEALEEALEALEELESSGAGEKEVAEAKTVAEEAEEAAEKAEEKAEKARQAAEEENLLLVEAAMLLKEATEASVLMAKTEAIDSSRIVASFRLGERFSGTFNEEMEPLYVHFEMTRGSRVKVSTTEAKVSISVLDDTGATILTLVPSSSGKGSVCSLEEGEYTLMIATMGTEKKVSVSINEYQSEEEKSSQEDDDIEWDEDETEMETLVEFD